MKKVLILFSFLILLCASYTKAQFNVDLIVFEPLPEVDFAAFAVANNLSGAPNILQITMSPAGQTVIVKGSVEWKQPGEGSFRQLFSFETHPFTSRPQISNSDFGSTDIRIKDSDSNSDATDENLKKGKPTGVYRLTVSVFDENGAELGEETEVINFLNPTQTLSIRLPDIGSTQDIGGVLAEWDEVTGASQYSIRANVRANSNQSLEEALNSGNPLIKDKDVGPATSTNLRNLLDREWLPGNEVVFQVTAVIPGPGGGTELFSNIVNFYFDAASDPQQSNIQQGLVNLFQNLADSESGQLLGLIQSGEVKFEDVTITSDNGQRLSIPEFQNLVNYLQTNPDAIINIKYNQK